MRYVVVISILAPIYRVPVVSPQQGWPHINCTLLRIGATWDPGSELSPRGVLFKGLQLSNSQGSKAIVGVDALGSCQ